MTLIHKTTDPDGDSLSAHYDSTGPSVVVLLSYEHARSLVRALTDELNG